MSFQGNVWVRSRDPEGPGNGDRGPVGSKERRYQLLQLQREYYYLLDQMYATASSAFIQ